MGSFTRSYAMLLFCLLMSSASVHARQGLRADIIEHLRETFGDSVDVVRDWITLADSEVTAIGKTSRSPFPDDTLRIYTCTSADTVVGYGILDNVMGKSRFITYLLILRPDGRTAGLEILIYRESHGGEISRTSFRQQFVGLGPGDPMVPGRDIRTISGATISSRAVTAGVSRLLSAFALISGRSR